jgi:L-erythro-3,5-diaminohexanoate dehydrogenase
MVPDAYGLSRVIEVPGMMPQRANRLDPSLPCREAEVLIDVESLNVDAASFKQLREETGGDPERIAARVRDIVRERGKMHNPVTGSGGILTGRVREVGPLHPAKGQLRPGERIATLVSLTLTPLHLDEVRAVHPGCHRLDVRGHAILFASGCYASLPDDIPTPVALAALDVCAAPALIRRHVRPGMTVAVLGAGKGGALSLAQARRSLGGQGRLLVLDSSQESLDDLQRFRLSDLAFQVDATRPLESLDVISRATRGELCDLAINCVSVRDTEMATILGVKEGGTAIFFSMATSFTAAALGADGVSKDIALVMGNGFVPGHARLVLDLLRTEPSVRQFFDTHYSAVC